MSLAAAWCIGGQPVRRGGSELTGGLVCYHVYETRDGGYMTLAALEPEFWTAFCAAVGREEWVGQQGEHTAPLLAELGFDVAEVERLQGQGVV